MPDRNQGFVSADEVARRAGVSRSAVSRCFTPGASIAPKTRARVMAAAEELGYRVNDLARGLLARQSRLVGLVVSRPELGFRAHLVAELSRALIRQGSIPLIIDTGDTKTDLAAACEIVIGHRASATIVLSGSPPPEVVALARLNGQPLVAIGRNEPEVDTVHIGNEAAARTAARRFAASGARRLGLVGSASATPMIVEREAAFLAEAALLGLPLAWERGADSDYAGGRQAAEALLSAADPPDALFCVNDLMAFGALDVAQRRGIDVPGALQVIGFDDIPEAAWEAYRLTSFRQDPALMAEKALELLARRRAAPELAPMTLRLAADLVCRGTTRPLP
ncbi:LacI family DNA-binding transcriptional regulator [Cereibacter changlensis]|uniref:LacI family DNA-binding transcriptional regulator n=1 Tax=Cereibacter changlensis TaxID=402884 RepID=UPI004034E4F4